MFKCNYFFLILKMILLLKKKYIFINFYKNVVLIVFPITKSAPINYYLFRSYFCRLYLDITSPMYFAYLNKF